MAPVGPILPVQDKRNILITSALPYVNNVPHLGNIIGCVLSADVYARFCRLRGHNTLYICGTDEYGTATETKAKKDGVTPQEICDKYHTIHADVYKWFNIDFDHFGRTSTEHQTQIAQDIFRKCEANGLIEEKETNQLYSESLKMFLADRFVHGTCPKCGYEDARGDQCDACGSIDYNSTDLINPRAALDGSIPVIRSTKHLFLKLGSIQTQLEEFIDKSKVEGKWTNNSITTTKTWTDQGLRSRCITRDLSWGTPVPVPGYENKVFYVWFDAPIGYLSITACYTDQWQQWWKTPENNVELVQFMGKDNVPFHTVVFPSTLIAANDNYTLLHHISTTEYLQYEDGKFSKSRNVGVFGDNAQSTGIPAYVWRYYLLNNRPEGSDSHFTWKELITKNNNELLKNVGNFVNRSLTFMAKPEYFGGKMPAIELNDDDRKFVSDVEAKLAEYNERLEAVQIKGGLKVAMAISSLGNEYLQHNAPWHLAKTDMARCGSVIAVSAHLAKLLAVVFQPYMPSLSDKIIAQLGLPADTKLSLETNTFALDIPAGHVIGQPEVLFTRYTEKQAQAWREEFGGDNDALPEFPLDLVAGEVVSAEDHPDTENGAHLYVLQVSIGKRALTVVSNLKAEFPAAEMIGKRVVVLTNAKKAKIRNVKSDGCILNLGGKAILSTSAAVGTRVYPKGTEVKVKKNFNLKKAFAGLKLHTDQDGVPCFGDKLEAPLCADDQPLTVVAPGADSAPQTGVKITP